MHARVCAAIYASNTHTNTMDNLHTHTHVIILKAFIIRHGGEPPRTGFNLEPSHKLIVNRLPIKTDSYSIRYVRGGRAFTLRAVRCTRRSRMHNVRRFAKIKSRVVQCVSVIVERCVHVHGRGLRNVKHARFRCLRVNWFFTWIRNVRNFVGGVIEKLDDFFKVQCDMCSLSRFC